MIKALGGFIRDYFKKCGEADDMAKKISNEVMAPIAALIAKAQKEGSVQAAELHAELEKLDLSPERIEQIYDTFEAMGIQVISPELELDVEEPMLDLDLDLELAQEQPLDRYQYKQSLGLNIY